MKKLIFHLLMLCSLLAHSQEEIPAKKKAFDFAFSPGIIQQRNTFVEANLLVGKVIIESHPKVPYIGISGVRIGVETDFNKTIAPKIGYEFALVGYALRLSAINYFQDNNSQFRLVPEIGISVCGWASLTYGYGISFNDGNLTDIGNHRVALSINLNKRLNKAVLFPVKQQQ
jgi:hypothetical protein